MKKNAMVFTLFFLLVGICALPPVVHAFDPFIGEIRMFGGNFAPRNWALCDGQLLPIAQNQALFSILGTTYGGDGRTTFGLPDLRGRFAMHEGNGPGLTSRRLGEKAGTETETLTNNQMPSHYHNFYGSSSATTTTDPLGHLLGTPSRTRLYSTGAANKMMNADAIENAGGGQSHNNIPPYQVVNYIIALTGIYPSRP